MSHRYDKVFLRYNIVIVCIIWGSCGFNVSAVRELRQSSAIRFEQSSRIISGRSHTNSTKSSTMKPNFMEPSSKYIPIKFVDTLKISTNFTSIKAPIEVTSQPNEEAHFITRSRPQCDSFGGNLGFCEEDSEYDVVRSRFDEILRNSPINEPIADMLKESFVRAPVLNERIGPFVTERPACPSVETIIYPKRGRNVNNDWVFVLNQGTVQQGVKVEKCLRDGSECQFGGGGLRHTTCRQKFIYKKLLTMNPSGNDIVTESVYMPSCCVCYVSSEFISSRASQRNENPFVDHENH